MRLRLGEEPLLKFLFGFAAGLAAFALCKLDKVQTLMPSKFCGVDQDGPVCAQQWIASVGPALALLFAAAGTLQIRKQLKQGQSSVISTERSQLRHEYEILTEIREGFLKRQRELEGDDAEIVSMRGKTWDDLEVLQYMFDQLYEYIGDVIRDPYVYDIRNVLIINQVRARRRMEFYRKSAEKWRAEQLTDETMLRRLNLVKRSGINDSDKLRRLIDKVLSPIGNRIATLSGRTNVKTETDRPSLRPALSTSIMPNRTAARPNSNAEHKMR